MNSGESHGLLEGLFRGVKLFALCSQDAVSQDDVAACCLRGYVARLLCFSELFVRFSELMQSGMGSALKRENLNQQLLAVGPSWLRVKECQHLRIHPAPQERFGFQNSELPGPFGTRISKSLALSVGFGLAFL